MPHAAGCVLFSMCVQSAIMRVPKHGALRNKTLLVQDNDTILQATCKGTTVISKSTSIG
jgi:hypothetical protein